VAVLVAVPVAYAANFRCDEVPCLGTSQKDKIDERAGDGKRDVIRAKGADDRIKADRFGRDADRLYGQEGDDRLNALDGDGRDYLEGGPGGDACLGDRGDRFSQCEISGNF
jgi:Ca2+-binding RTX toxin-like protein